MSIPLENIICNLYFRCDEVTKTCRWILRYVEPKAVSINWHDLRPVLLYGYYYCYFSIIVDNVDYIKGYLYPTDHDGKCFLMYLSFSVIYSVHTDKLRYMSYRHICFHRKIIIDYISQSKSQRWTFSAIYDLFLLINLLRPLTRSLNSESTSIKYNAFFKSYIPFLFYKCKDCEGKLWFTQHLSLSQLLTRSS